MDSTSIRLISEKLDYQSIINLGLINKETNRIILKELQYFSRFCEFWFLLTFWGEFYIAEP